MFKKTLMVTAMSATFVAAFALPMRAFAADDKELSDIRAQMK